MTAYTIVKAKITNPQRFSSYIQAVPAVVEHYGGTYLVQGGGGETLEGMDDNYKYVIHRWPSVEVARSFWCSEEYQNIKKLREGTGIFQVTLLEGVKKCR